MLKKILSFFIYFFAALLTFFLLYLSQYNKEYLNLKTKISDCLCVTGTIFFCLAGLRLAGSNDFFRPLKFFKEKLLYHIDATYPEYCETHQPPKKSSLILFIIGFIFMIPAFVIALL